MTDETTNAEPSGASGGSLANYSVIPNSCLRGSTVEQRFCEPTVAGSTPAAGLYVQWIPVEERMPEPYTLVLGGFVTMGEWVECLTAWHETHWYETEPSHWMPLPAPPMDAK